MLWEQCALARLKLAGLRQCQRLCLELKPLASLVETNSRLIADRRKGRLLQALAEAVREDGLHRQLQKVRPTSEEQLAGICRAGGQSGVQAH